MRQNAASGVFTAAAVLGSLALVGCMGNISVEDEQGRGAFMAAGTGTGTGTSPRPSPDAGVPKADAKVDATKTDLRPDLSNCTSCICAYAPCCYDSDCTSITAGSTCSAGKCMKDGKEVDSDDKRACQDWMNAQTGCDKKAIVVKAAKYDPMGCSNVRLEVKGHSSTGQCCPFIDTVFEFCRSGCTNVTACQAGCNTFKDQAAAQAYFDACRAKLDAAGVKYSVSVTGNQSLSSCTRTSKMTLTCNGTTYQPCDTGKCYWHGEHRKCSKPDGSVTDQTCCATGSGDPQWTNGTSCPDKKCSELQGGSCWGGTQSPTCTKPDGTKTTLKCCKCGKPVGWIEQGTWGEC